MISYDKIVEEINELENQLQKENVLISYPLDFSKSMNIYSYSSISNIDLKKSDLFKLSDIFQRNNYESNPECKVNPENLNDLSNIVNK